MVSSEHLRSELLSFKVRGRQSLPGKKNMENGNSSPCTTSSSSCSASPPPLPCAKKRPVLVRRMTSGTLSEGDQVVLFDVNSTKSPLVAKEHSLCDSITSVPSAADSSSSSFASSTTTGSTTKDNVDTDQRQQGPSTFTAENSDTSTAMSGIVPVFDIPHKAPEAHKVEEIFHVLTDAQKETAAHTSWSYYVQVVETGNQDRTRRDSLCRDMIRRHLRGEHGDITTAYHRIIDTLEGRVKERLDLARIAFHSHHRTLYYQRNPQLSQRDIDEHEAFCADMRDKLHRWLGPHGRVCLLDTEESTGRCFFYHRISLFTLGTRYDRDAVLYTAVYMMEKAIACTEHYSNEQQHQVNVIIDFRNANMRDKNQTLPISIALEILELMRKHHPDRMFSLYMLDAPFLARLAFPIFRPFVRHITPGGVHFVTGKRQCLNTFGPKMALYDRASNLDMTKFFQLPFDRVYEDLHGDELHY